ncbi:hypothetical protein OBV_09010 [Oscillibacter valericigenes Sjm18-20]|nr:hypothetical protein OBV_09010 [Oscillibacter valericigenes Sjm18-20]
MSKTNITIPFDEEKLSALDFSLQKENATAQQCMEKDLAELYEKSVPEPLREYLDSKSSSAAKSKRPTKSPASKMSAAKPVHSPVPPSGEDTTKMEPIK